MDGDCGRGVTWISERSPAAGFHKQAPTDVFMPSVSGAAVIYGRFLTRCPFLQKESSLEDLDGNLSWLKPALDSRVNLLVFVSPADSVSDAFTSK